MSDAIKCLITTAFLAMSGALLAAEQSVVLSVPGMRCPACPVTVMAAIKRVEGVKLVNVDLETKLARVSYDDQLTNISNIQQAAKNVGFPSQVVEEK